MIMAKKDQFNAQRKVKCAYLVPQGAWLSTIITGAEVYAAVDFFWQPAYLPEYSSFDISFFNEPGEVAQNFTGLSIQTKELDDRQYDLITIPAIWRPDIHHIQNQHQVLAWLKKQHAGGALIIGLITGQFYLAQAGLLDGKEATVHGAFASTFQHLYPEVRVNLKRSITESDKLICVTGHKSCMDAMMMTIARFCGEETAQLCAKYYEFTEPNKLESDFMEAQSLDVLVNAAKETLRHRFQEPISLNQLAQILNASPRTLSRHFQSVSGESPMQYLQKIRLQNAKQLLSNTSLSIEHIAQQVGFNSTSVFGRAFKGAFQKTPLQYRKFIASKP
jgi:transcriptional regulator GlxA family with amidase domain